MHDALERAGRGLARLAGVGGDGRGLPGAGRRGARACLVSARGAGCGRVTESQRMALPSSTISVAT